MDSKSMLSSILQYALNNGWQPELETGSLADKKRYLLKLTKPFHVRGIILSHDFARAFFGESNWRVKLQYMVLLNYDEQIDYLYIHVPNVAIGQNE